MFVDLGATASTGMSSVSDALGPVARGGHAVAAQIVGAASDRLHALGSQEVPQSATSPARSGDTAAIETNPMDSVSGMLVVFSRVPLDLYVKGRKIGTTEDGQILLAPGRYRIDLVSTWLNYRGQIVLDVKPAGLTSHTVKLPNGMVQVNTTPGAEVWIEGQLAGVAPLGPLPAQIGTREIAVKHPDLGEKREIIEVKYGETTETTIVVGPPLL
jgi:hypothetical protein